MIGRALLALALCALLTTLPAQADIGRDFSGVYRHDPGRSLLAHGAVPDREMFYDIDLRSADAVLVQRGLLANGKPFARRWTGKPDGMRHEVSGGGATLSLGLVGPVMSVTGEDARGVFLRQRCKLVENGRALTCRGTRRGPDGSMDNFFDWYQREK